MTSNVNYNEIFYLLYKNKPIKGTYRITERNELEVKEITWQKSKEITLEDILSYEYAILYQRQTYFIPKFQVNDISYDCRSWSNSDYDWYLVEHNLFCTSIFEALHKAEVGVKALNHLIYEKYEPKFEDKYYIPDIITGYSKQTWRGDSYDYKQLVNNRIYKTKNEALAVWEAISDAIANV